MQIFTKKHKLVTQTTRQKTSADISNNREKNSGFLTEKINY
jgi:hypothetical protein